MRQMAVSFVKVRSEPAHQWADGEQHDKSEHDHACEHQPQRRAETCRMHHNHDHRKQAPGGDVIHGCTTDCYCAHSRPQHIPLAKDACEHRKCRDTHCGTHEECKA